MPRIPTIASATVREGHTYPTEVRDVVAREQAGQQQRIEAGRAYASLVQQVLREEGETGDVVLVGARRASFAASLFIGEKGGVYLRQ
jgi:nucleotide-binding universal stress UspA family protein